MDINFKQIIRNRTPLKRYSRNIEYIVIHDTGNRSKGSNAYMHYVYFNNGYRGSSADFFVDDKQILQINDYYNYYSWHCGDAGGKYGIGNRNSIGIEICINQDGDYNKAVNKTIELVKHLMEKLDVPIGKVVRHFDASRKICPGSMSRSNWVDWLKFKNRLANDTNTKTYNNDNNSVMLQKNLVELGYKLAIDGIIGPQTKGHVMDFQRVTGLTIDGIYGPKTEAKLDSILDNERLTIIYRSVNILNQTQKTGQDPLIIDRSGWIKKATTDVGVYWLLRKVADYVS